MITGKTEKHSSILAYIYEKLRSEKMHMTLIDPANQSPTIAGEIAETVARLGSDAIMVGGSTGVTTENLEQSVIEIKKRCDVPVILFPAGAKALTNHVDAIYFISLLNSRNVKCVVREQMEGALIIKQLGIEPIPTGYLVFEPGMKVAEVGEADVIAQNDIKSAVAYALTAQYLGMKLLYLEAGSGAPTPISPEIICAVKKEISIPLVVGGGLRTPEMIRKTIEAGADIVVTGTVAEFAYDLEEVMAKIIGAVKGSGQGP